MLEKLLDIIAPNTCLICEQESGSICLWCLPDAFEALPERCFHCLGVSPGSAVCKKCRKQVRLTHVWSATVYKDNAQKLIQHMKFNPDRSACKIIARWLDQTMPYLEDVTITYAPTAPQRIRQRGFDHSRLIAKEFAQLRGLPFKTLVARQGTARQVGSKKATRIEQAKDSYRVCATEVPKHVVVIDDIVTTGATLNEIARILKTASARQVDGIVFAQAI